MVLLWKGTQPAKTLDCKQEAYCMSTEGQPAEMYFVDPSIIFITTFPAADASD